MFRMLFMTFYGEDNVDPHTQVHESPRSMTIPLVVLAAGSVVAGWVGLPPWLSDTNFLEHFLEPVFEPLPLAAAAEEHLYSHLFEFGMAALSVLVAFAGIALAWSMYYRKSEKPALWAAKFSGAYAALLNKYYVDELYDGLFVNRSKDAGGGLWKFDARVVDGGVNGSAWLTVRAALVSGWADRWIVDGLVRFAGAFVKTFSWPVRLVQTGYVQKYAMLMLLGVLFFIGYVLWG
jgi:NADH-quinone oxidoreductase subunit L